MNVSKRFHLATPLAALAAFGLLAGTASADTNSVSRQLAAKGYTMADPIAAIPDRGIDSWEYLDDENVIVRNGVAAHYLVTLNGACPALATAGSIEFNAAIAGLSSENTLLIGNSRRAPECTISRVYELDRPLG